MSYGRTLFKEDNELFLKQYIFGCDNFDQDYSIEKSFNIAYKFRKIVLHHLKGDLQQVRKGSKCLKQRDSKKQSQENINTHCLQRSTFYSKLLLLNVSRTSHNNTTSVDQVLYYTILWETFHVQTKINEAFHLYSTYLHLKNPSYLSWPNYLNFINMK